MRRPTVAFAVAATALIGLTACGGGGDPLSSSSTSAQSSSAGTSGGSGGSSIIVGSANFSESALLGEIYAGALKAKGVNVSTKLNIGSREIYMKALEDGSIDLVPEYTGALAFYYDKNVSETDPQKVYDAVAGLIPDSLQLLNKSAAEDNDSITVTKETADKFSLKTIEDVKAHMGEMTLGAPAEFKARPQGIPGLEKTYGITFKSFRPLEGQQLLQALLNGQVDAANVFTTDPNIASNGLVTLEDTKRLFGSQNVVPVINKSKNTPEITAALDAVSAKLTTATLADLLKKTDIDKQDAATVAKQFLSDNGLG